MNAKRSGVLDAVATLLEANGLSVEDLAQHRAQHGGSTHRPPTPTVSEWVAEVAPIVPPGAAKTYQRYWRLLVEHLGDRRLDEVSSLDLKRVVVAAKDGAVLRRNSKGGVGAQENCVAAMRCVFKEAVVARHIARDPAADVPKPRRKPNSRRALSTAELEQVWQVVVTGGDDSLLDAIVVRTFIETGCRRAGLVGLRLCDLRADRLQVRLVEKGDIERWQPVSQTLFDALVEFAASRGARKPEDKVFRYRPRKGERIGRPMTNRRLNTLADRIQNGLPWAKQLGVSPHYFRHSSTSAIERVAGFAVARAFAGHTAGGETTTTYIKAQENEVAAAVSILTGEPHPLAATPKPSAATRD